MTDDYAEGFLRSLYDATAKGCVWWVMSGSDPSTMEATFGSVVNFDRLTLVLSEHDGVAEVRTPYQTITGFWAKQLYDSVRNYMIGEERRRMKMALAVLSDRMSRMGPR